MIKSLDILNKEIMITGTDRISKDYYTNFESGMENNTSMFLQDFCNDIVPTYDLESKNINCYLTPTNKSLEKKLYEFLPNKYGMQSFPPTFNKLILNTIIYIADCILHDGHIVFEFVKQKDIEGNEFFTLIRFLDSEIRYDRDYIIQTIPNESSDDNKTSKQIIVPLSKCFIIKFPDMLGGEKKYLKFIKEFEKIGSQSPIMMHARNSFPNDIGYDVMEHQKLHDLELRKMSLSFNWHHRAIYSGKDLFSGYYNFNKRISFRKSQIILRDYIINELKSIISKWSGRIGEKTELNIEGLPQLSEVENKIKEWQTGELVMDRINDVF